MVDTLSYTYSSEMGLGRLLSYSVRVICILRELLTNVLHSLPTIKYSHV